MADSTTKISSEPEEKNTTPASSELEDWPSVLDQLEQGSQVADDDDKGELSLLDEAIAELDQASKTISTVAGEFEFDLPEQQATEEDDNIPVLEEAVSLPTDSQAANEAAIPTLGESAIVIHAQEQAGETEAEPGDEEREELLSELEVIAQDLSLPAEEDADAGAELVMHEQEEALLEQALSGDIDASSGHQSPPSSLSGFSDSELEHLPSFVEAVSETVESADDMQDAASDESVSQMPQPDPDEEQTREAVVGAEPGPSPSEAHDAPLDTPGAVAATAGLGSSLHDALSRRLESLVSEAIASLNDELQQQLAGRMESLLLEAVDQAMPGLMEQLASGLRQQVQSHVQQELPRIVGDMLGSIRVDEQT